MAEHPQARIARIFGMGKYGEELAAEILGEYREMIAQYMEETGGGLAAYVIRSQEWEYDH
jgi:hypothetical protein